MKDKRIFYLIVASLAYMPTLAFAQTDAVDRAFKACTWMDMTGLASQPCEVSGWRSTVTLYLDMSSAEARETCAGLPNILRTKDAVPGGDWTLEIKSPYSNDNTIAQCPLR